MLDLFPKPKLFTDIKQTLGFFPDALSETVKEMKWLPEQIRPIAKKLGTGLSSLLTPSADTEYGQLVQQTGVDPLGGFGGGMKITKQPVPFLTKAVKSLEKKPFQVGITSVKGFETQQIDDLVDEAKKLEMAGLFKESTKLYQKSLEPGVSRLKTFFSQSKDYSIEKLEKTLGRYFGETEPSIYLRSIVKPEKIDNFIYDISAIAQKEFKQRSVIFHRWVSEKLSPEIIDQTKGFSREPAVDLLFSRKLLPNEMYVLDELFNKYNLPGATLKPDYSGIEIVNLSAFNKNYEQFKQSTTQLAQEIHSRGLLAEFRAGLKETWHIGIDQENALTTYESFRSSFEAPLKQKISIFPGFKDLTTKFLDYAKGKTTLSRQEIMDFARRPELKKGEADLLLKKLEEFEPKGVIKELETLSQEARKFKSAEEFVGQWITPKVGRLPEKLQEFRKFYPALEKAGFVDEFNQVTKSQLTDFYSRATGKAQPLGDLATEARKYKSAEEFVGSQQRVFRGGERIDSSRITEFGIPVSKSRQVAEDFGKGKFVQEFFIDPNAKIATEADLPEIAKLAFPNAEPQLAKESLMLHLGLDVKATPQLLKLFKDAGFDAIDLSKISPAFVEQEIRILNPNILKTKSQLTDFYSRVAKGTDKLSAQEFADSIRRDLLELKPVKVKDPQYGNVHIDRDLYEESPFDDVLGKNYEEVVFESPIVTNGSSHYPNSKNYFAHARGDEVVESGKKIWREQEIQSDLLQKEGLQRVEGGFYGRGEAYSKMPEAINDPQTLQDVKNYQQLQPFTNDRFGERIMRERIKEKAQQGYSNYRLPTGETIGKIEGFQPSEWFTKDFQFIKQDKMKVGQEVIQGQGRGNSYIITDILGDGRFKAVPKDAKIRGTNIGVHNMTIEQIKKSTIYGLAETFDLTGKSNPQYRRYSDWGKFLKNKYGGKEVTDLQGNTWMEIDLKPEMKLGPIEAFGVMGVPFTPGLVSDKNKREEPLFVPR